MVSFRSKREVCMSVTMRSSPIDDFVVVGGSPPSKPYEELRRENMHLRIENSTLMNNIMEQQKEIMRLQNVVLEQNKEFQAVLIDMTARQVKLEEKMKNSESTSKMAMASTAISIACAIIGGTCGFSGAYKIVARLVAGVVTSETSAAAACAVAAGAASTVDMIKV